MSHQITATNITTATNFSVNRFFSEFSPSAAASTAVSDTALESLNQTKSSYESADSGCDVADTDVNTNQSSPFTCCYFLPPNYTPPLDKMKSSTSPHSLPQPRPLFDTFSFRESSSSSASPAKTSPPVVSPSFMGPPAYHPVNPFHQSVGKMPPRKPSEVCITKPSSNETKRTPVKHRSSKSNNPSTGGESKTGEERGSGASYKYLSWREKDRRRRFREEWKHLWLVVPYGSYEVMCLVCHKIMTQRKLDTIKRHTIRRHAELLTMSILDRQRLYYELISQRFRHLGEQRSRELFLEDADSTKSLALFDPFNNNSNNTRISTASQPKLGGLLRSPLCPSRSRVAPGPIRSGTRRPRVTSQNRLENTSFRSVMGSGRGAKKHVSVESSRGEEIESIMRQTRKLRDDRQQHPGSEGRLQSLTFMHSSGSENIPSALANEMSKAYAQMKSSIAPGRIRPEAIEILNKMTHPRRLSPLGASLSSETEQKTFEQLILGSTLQSINGYPPNLAMMTNYLMSLQNSSCFPENVKVTGNDFNAINHEAMEHLSYSRREPTDLALELTPNNGSNSQLFGLKRLPVETCSSLPKENFPKQQLLEAPAILQSASNAYSRRSFRPQTSENPPTNDCVRTGQTTSSFGYPTAGFSVLGAQPRGQLQMFPNFAPMSSHDNADVRFRSKEVISSSLSGISAYACSYASKAIDMTKNRCAKIDNSSLTERLNRLINTWDNGRKPHLPPKSIDLSLANRP